MADKLHLNILTPYGHYLDAYVDFLEVRSEKYSLGIYPKHTSLVSTVDISKMVVRMNGNEHTYAVGGGAIQIEKDEVTLVLNSIERVDEIDLERANAAKERAEKRLKEKSLDDSIDVNRAKLALLRALNRIDIKNKF